MGLWSSLGHLGYRRPHADQDLSRCPGDGTPVGIEWARIGSDGSHSGEALTLRDGGWSRL